MIVITEHRTGLLTRFQESAHDTPTRNPWHLSCGKARSGTSRARANCQQLHHWTLNLPERLASHENGHGSRLLTVAKAAGIGFTLARTTTGTRHTERAIKNAGGQVRYCPLCTPKPWKGRWA